MLCAEARTNLFSARIDDKVNYKGEGTVCDAYSTCHAFDWVQS